MSENPSDNWQEMLRAIMGDDAANEIIRALGDNGIDPNAMSSMLNPANMGMITQQIQAMLGSSGDGPVNWQITEQIARETITRSHLDRLVTSEAEAHRSALSVASLWLDAATDIDPATGPNLAFSRLDFVAHSLPTFRRLMEPLGANISRAFAEVMSKQAEGMPPEMTAFLGGDPSHLVKKMIASFLGMQYGAALAELAVHSFGSTDTGIPLMEGSSAALVPANVEAFATDLDVPIDEVRFYVAVREAAAARLYTRVPWLRSRVIDSVAEFARGIEIDMGSIEDQVRSLNLENPESMTELDLSAVFVMEQSQAQDDAVARLELLLSLIEGWVADVSARAVLPHLPHAISLREMFTRRSATDNPAKLVWGAQLGVDLAPRRLRDAAKFWELASTKLGQSGRDQLWNHPDLLPTAEVLDNPEAFFSDDSAAIEEELDSFLADLFRSADENNQQSGEYPKAGKKQQSDEEQKDNPSDSATN